MEKINKNKVLISREELALLLGAASIAQVEDGGVEFKQGCLFLDCSAGVIARVMDYIWGEGKALEKDMEEIKGMGKDGPFGMDRPPAETEDMRGICRSLLPALQKTSALHNLTDMVYDPYMGVTVKFASGNRKLIHTGGDSGIAMIRRIAFSL